MIQTIGRAARNINGRAILYADFKTKSIEQALEETARRRIKQIQFNKVNNIKPKSTSRNIEESIEKEEKYRKNILKGEHDEVKSIDELKKEMLVCAENLNFEEAAKIRDKIKILEEKELGINENFKKVLITGGAQRIGSSSITKHLASNGLDVAIQYNTSYSNVKKLENLF